jgi:2,5-dihydroxypyridine 5,6-dioxygenase
MAFHYPGVGPPSFGRYIELLPVAEEVLRRSGIQAGERVVLYTDTQRNKDQVDAFFAAATMIGAEVCVVMSTPRNDPHREPLGLALRAMLGASTVLDLSSISWIYTPPFSQVLDAGVRVLSCMSNVDTCLKCRPRDDVAALARAGGEAIDKAEVIRVTSSFGTELILNKRGRRGIFQEGLLEGPGSWDNFPSAQCACAPLEDSAEGVLVVNEGDILLPLKHFVRSPIRMTIEAGRIVRIEGGGDAALLRGWFEKWNDPNSYVVAHIGFGCDPRCEIAAMQLMEWESYAGNVMIAFGANDGRFLGGKTRARSHIDIVLLNADFVLDGERMIEGGRFVSARLPRLRE